MSDHTHFNPATISPCRFCDGLTVLMQLKPIEEIRYRVVCTHGSCNAAGPIAVTIEGAIEKWNKGTLYAA